MEAVKVKELTVKFLIAKKEVIWFWDYLIRLTWMEQEIMADLIL